MELNKHAAQAVDSDAELCREIPLVFSCQGEELLGILHAPAQPKTVGLLCVIAGGPQYRAGVGRNMVLMARELSAAGYAVFRFDHRGLGDSAGEFHGFESTHEDIQAAVDQFRAQVPALQKVVLWGGCDAASGCMMHGAYIDGVSSMVLGNPWISTQETQSAVRQQHYLKRLREWSFWQKLFRFEYDLSEYVRAAAKKIIARKPASGAAEPAAESAAGQNTASADHWMDRMLNGLRDFSGPVLFLMSGQSMVSQEFDLLIGRNKGWKKACQNPKNRRLDLPDADQTFSSADARAQVNRALLDWVRELGE